MHWEKKTFPFIGFQLATRKFCYCPAECRTQSSNTRFLLTTYSLKQLTSQRIFWVKKQSVGQIVSESDYTAGLKAKIIWQITIANFLTEVTFKDSNEGPQQCESLCWANETPRDCLCSEDNLYNPGFKWV